MKEIKDIFKERRSKIAKIVAICPECGSVMGKAGPHWSGRHEVQNWLCKPCGRKTIRPTGFAKAIPYLRK